MDFMLLLFNASLNSVILLMTINASAPAGNPNYWIGLFFAFITGYGISILRDFIKNTFTLKTSLIKFFGGLGLCYLAYMAKTSSFPELKLEWFIVGASFGSLYIIEAGDKIFSLGVPAAARLLLDNLLNYIDKGKTTKEDKI